jgi:MFS family permease
VARQITGDDRPPGGPPVDAATARGALRAAAAALLIGGLIFFAGVSRPVVGDWAEAFDDEAKRIAIAEANEGQFTLGWTLMGLGFILMGIALGLWGRAVARLETRRRALAAILLGTAAAIGGFGPGLVRVITPFVDLERAAGDGGWLSAAFMAGAVALSLGFIGFGILTWRGPAPKWAGILLALTGAAAAVTIPAWYMAGALVFGLVGVVHFRPGWPRKAHPPAATP